MLSSYHKPFKVNHQNKRHKAVFIARRAAEICGFCAISPCIIAKPSCSRVNRSRTIALGVARLQNGLAPLQNAFTALQNGLAPLQNAFAALFLVLAVVRGAIARLFRRLDGLLGLLVVRRGVACAVRVGHRVAAEVFEVFLYPLHENGGRIGTVADPLRPLF